jgi:aminoacrylate hydrolase
MAQDVIALMDRLGIARAHIVGHSLGGAIAQSLAIDHPQRVAALVIYAGWGRRDPFFEQVMTMRRRILETMGVDFFISTSPLMIYPAAWISANQKFLARAEASAKAAFPGVPTLASRIDACIDFDRWHDPKRITARTLALCARDDISTPPNLSEDLASQIPGAKLELIPFGGHNAHVVAPKQVSAALATFLSSADA